MKRQSCRTHGPHTANQTLQHTKRAQSTHPSGRALPATSGKGLPRPKNLRAPPREPNHGGVYEKHQLAADNYSPAPHARALLSQQGGVSCPCPTCGHSHALPVPLGAQQGSHLIPGRSLQHLAQLQHFPTGTTSSTALCHQQSRRNTRDVTSQGKLRLRSASCCLCQADRASSPSEGFRRFGAGSCKPQPRRKAPAGISALLELLSEPRTSSEHPLSPPSLSTPLPGGPSASRTHRSTVLQHGRGHLPQTPAQTGCPACT